MDEGEFEKSEFTSEIQATEKKTSVWLIIGIVVFILLVFGGGYMGYSILHTPGIPEFNANSPNQATIIEAINNSLSGDNAGLLQIQSAEILIVLEKIIKYEPDSLAVLLNTLETGTDSQKAFALGVLYNIRSRELVPQLDDLLLKDKENKNMTLSLIHILQATRDSRAKEAIQSVVQSSDEDIKTAALYTLGFVNGDKTFIRGFVNDNSEKVKSAAFGALAVLGEDVYGDLRTLLQSNDSVIRNDAVKSLGYLSNVEAKNLLTQMVSTPEYKFRVDASFSLLYQHSLGMSAQEKAAYFENLTEDKEEVLSSWALDRLTDLQTKEAKNELEILSKNKNLSATILDKTRFIVNLRKFY